MTGVQQPRTVPPVPDDMAAAVAQGAALLSDLRAHIGQMTDAALAARLRAACAAGWGDWRDPAEPRANRPATHLHEVRCLGAGGAGLTEVEAARSWRIAVLRIAAAEAEGAA